jgi:hypothetical protein
MTMSERQAAVKANQYYAEWADLSHDLRGVYVREYSRLLGNLAPFMSQTQLDKLADWDHGVSIYHKVWLTYFRFNSINDHEETR